MHPYYPILDCFLCFLTNLSIAFLFNTTYGLLLFNLILFVHSDKLPSSAIFLINSSEETVYWCMGR